MNETDGTDIATNAADNVGRLRTRTSAVIHAHSWSRAESGDRKHCTVILSARAESCRLCACVLGAQPRAFAQSSTLPPATSFKSELFGHGKPTLIAVVT